MNNKYIALNSDLCSSIPLNNVQINSLKLNFPQSNFNTNNAKINSTSSYSNIITPRPLLSIPQTNLNIQNIKLGSLSLPNKPMVLKYNNATIMQQTSNATSQKNSVITLKPNMVTANKYSTSSFVPILPNITMPFSDSQIKNFNNMQALNLIQLPSNVNKDLIYSTHQDMAFKPILIPNHQNVNYASTVANTNYIQAIQNYPQPLLLSPLGNNMNIHDTIKGRKRCNCNKSQCLKLYCECFANGEFCSNCNCNNCYNNIEYEDERKKAIKAILERNPMAFHPKIGKSNVGEVERKHAKGCNCRRSGCLKNYCECFEAKITCSSLCKCNGCKNYEDSYERRTSMLLPPFLIQSNSSGLCKPSFFVSTDSSPLNIAESNKQVNIDFKHTIMSNSINTYHLTFNSSHDAKLTAPNSFRDSFTASNTRPTPNTACTSDMSRKMLDEIAYGDPHIKDELFTQQSFDEIKLLPSSKLHLPRSCLYPSNFLTDDIVEAIVSCMLAQAYDFFFTNTATNTHDHNPHLLDVVKQQQQQLAVNQSHVETTDLRARLGHETNVGYSTTNSNDGGSGTGVIVRRPWHYLEIERAITKEFGQCLLRIINVLKNHSFPISSSTLTTPQFKLFEKKGDSPTPPPSSFHLTNIHQDNVGVKDRNASSNFTAVTTNLMTPAASILLSNFDETITSPFSPPLPPKNRKSTATAVVTTTLLSSPPSGRPQGSCGSKKISSNKYTLTNTSFRTRKEDGGGVYDDKNFTIPVVIAAPIQNLLSLNNNFTSLPPTMPGLLNPSEMFIYPPINTKLAPTPTDDLATSSSPTIEETLIETVSNDKRDRRSKAKKKFNSDYYYYDDANQFNTSTTTKSTSSHNNSKKKQLSSTNHHLSSKTYIDDIF